MIRAAWIGIFYQYYEIYSHIYYLKDAITAKFRITIRQIAAILNLNSHNALPNYDC